jgi:hypothetical protein
MQSGSTNKQKRIDKEINLLRNLPKEYKIGRKQTHLGKLLYLELDRHAVTS